MSAVRPARRFRRDTRLSAEAVGRTGRHLRRSARLNGNAVDPLATSPGARRKPEGSGGNRRLPVARGVTAAMVTDRPAASVTVCRRVRHRGGRLVIHRQFPPATGFPSRGGGPWRRRERHAARPTAAMVEGGWTDPAGEHGSAERRASAAAAAARRRSRPARPLLRLRSSGSVLSHRGYRGAGVPIGARRGVLPGGSGAASVLMGSQVTQPRSSGRRREAGRSRRRPRRVGAEDAASRFARSPASRGRGAVGLGSLMCGHRRVIQPR